MNAVSFVSGKVDSPYQYDKSSMASAWPQIHAIDQEPLPTVAGLKQLLKGTDLALESASPRFGQDFDGLADALLDAWVDFHNGDFQSAYQKGMGCGLVGYYVAMLALNTYATYLAPTSEQAGLLLQAAETSQKAADAFPRAINFQYAYALNIGRYSEAVSITKAISSGAAVSFKKSLETCLKLKPDHIPSLLAQGALFAQVIGAIGELPAKLSFGATRKKVFSIYENALKIANPPPVIFVEYAKSIQLLDKKNQGMVERLLKEALDAPVLDPLDAFDQQEAVALLRQL